MKNAINKTTHCIKTFLFIVGSVLLLHSNAIKAASINSTILNAPCTQGSDVLLSFSGFSYPLYVHYTVGKNRNSIDTVNSGDDTIKNVKGLLNINVSDLSGNSIDTTIITLPFTYQTALYHATCPNNGAAKVNIYGGSSPFDIYWISMNSQDTIATGDTVSLPADNYILKIRDAAGCTLSSEEISDSLYIYSSSKIKADIVSVDANCTNGSLTVSNPSGGVAPYTYLWNNGAVTSSINNLIQGNYSVLVTDVNGCSKNLNGYVKQSKTIKVNFSPKSPTCIQSDGELIAFGSGGKAPYTYLWNNASTNQKQLNLASGYYTVMVTDANGCFGNSGTSIFASSPISVTYNTTKSLCTAPTGSATLSIAGGKKPYKVEWNTYPAKYGVSIASMPPGDYNFTVTDSVGCIRTGTVTIPPISQLSGYTTAKSELCKSQDGEATCHLFNIQTKPQYLWSNGQTTSTITGLSSGHYTCVVTDSNSCTITKSVYVNRISNIQANLATTATSCLYSSDGSITANPTNGTPPYTFLWSNGATTSSITNLITGYYSVYIKDANGCELYQNCFLGTSNTSNSCYCTISGTVYDDQNNNCVKDPGELGIENIAIHCQGFGYAYTDANGYYSFKVPTGNYTISERTGEYYVLSACQNNDTATAVNAASGCNININFANTINPIKDLSIYTTRLSPMVPGNKYTQAIVIENQGTIVDSTIKSIYIHDGQLNFNSFSPSVYQHTSGHIYADNANFPALNPGHSSRIIVEYQVPTNIPSGTEVFFSDTIADSALSNWINDYTPWDNVHSYKQTVVSSYDPNAKEVFPTGKGPNGLLDSKDSTLRYTIHFQNTGNYYAQNIVLIDTIDNSLDLSTLKPGYGSHAYKATLSEGRVLTFRFDNINLPWTGVASNGMVSYSIKLKKGLPENTVIKNIADIYFDYNAPIRTNYTINTTPAKPIGLMSTPTPKEFGLSIQPNPSADVIRINIEVNRQQPAQIKIMNISGSVVFEKSLNLNQGTTFTYENISSLATGIYIVQVQSEDGVMSQKLLIQR